MKDRLFRIILCSSVLIQLLYVVPVSAQNNAFKINDCLYDYFRKTEKNLDKANGLSMTDTLFQKAKSVDDLKAQCIALYLRVRYYYFHKDITNAKKELQRIAPFIRRTPYLQYYFGAWSIIIGYYINSPQKQEAIDEIKKFQEEAYNLKNDFGIINSHRYMGELLFNQRAFRLALPQYKRALALAKERNFKDIYNINIEIGRSYEYLTRWKDGKTLLQNSIKSNINKQYDYPSYCTLLSIYCLDEHKDTTNIKETFNIVQNFYNEHLLLGNDIKIYYESMYNYYYFYKNDETKAKEYTKLLKYEPNTVYKFLYLGRKAEAEGDIKSAIDYYKQYCYAIHEMNLHDERLMLSWFVPQLEYQKQEHNKALLQQSHAKMELENMHDREMLLTLNEEKNRERLQMMRQEQSILQNQVAISKLTLTQKKRELLLKRYQSSLQKRNTQLLMENTNWYITIGLLGFVVLFTLLGLYIFYLRKQQKQLKKDKEMAEHSEQIKTLFFQNMNHEIRTPLNAIAGFNELLNGEMAGIFTPQEKEDYIQMIDTNSQLLMTLVNDVLDLSKFESGTYELSPSNINLLHLCHTALESVRGKQAKGVELILDPDSDKLFTLYTDAQRVQQVLTNYLTNACKYTEQGSITLSYRILPDQIRFAVSDTGRGVKQEDAESVFKRFCMLDKSKRGTGLGLHICRLIAGLLHGKVYVDTSYRQGARFVFDHPLKSVLGIIAFLFCFLQPLNAQQITQLKQTKYYNYYLNRTETSYTLQSKLSADSLLAAGRKNRDADAQCMALLCLTRHYCFAGNEKEMHANFERCKSFSTQTHNYLYIFSAWRYILRYYSSHNQYDITLKQLDSYKTLMKHYNNKYGLIDYLYETGNYYILQQRYASALSYYLELINLSEVSSPVYLMAGKCYYMLGMYQKALPFLHKAYDFTTLQSTKMLALCHLVKCYCQLHDEGQATTTINELNRLYEKNPKLLNKGSYNSTQYYYYKYIKKDHTRYSEAQKGWGDEGNLDNTAIIAYNEGDYKQALQLFKKSVDYCQNWLHKDLSKDNNFVNLLDFEMLTRENDKIKLNNLRLKLKEAESKRLLLQLKHEKTNFMMKKELIGSRKKREELALQQSLLKHQKIELEKQRIINYNLFKEKELTKRKVELKIISSTLLLLLVVIPSLFYLINIQKKENQLKRETKAAEEAERAKSRFFENMNNEIRGPLHTIVSLNRTLNDESSKGLLPEVKTRMVNQLNNSTSYLTTLINNVLDISKMESGTFKLYFEEINIDELCSLVIEETKSYAKKGVSMKSEVHNLLSCKDDEISQSGMLFTDVGRMRFVLKAFLKNACDYTSEGQITLAYTTQKDYVIFSVTDTGCGLSGKEMESVFYYDQIEGLHNNKKIGLSLHIVRLIAEMFHGKAYIDKSYKQGARFIFEHSRNLKNLQHEEII